MRTGSRRGVHAARGGRHARPSRPLHYRGNRRADPPAPPRESGAGQRVVLVAAAVGAVLIGTGALARGLPELPVPEPRVPAGAGQPVAPVVAPPATPGAATSPPAAGSRPAPEPTPAATAEPPAEPPVSPTAPVPTPAPTGSPAQPTPTPGPTGPPEPASFEAEAAELSGFVHIFAVEQASGGEVVGMIGRQADSHVRFVGVIVAAPGDYQLTLYYVSAPDAQGQVAVNGAAPATVDFPALGDAQTVGSVAVPVELAAGPNEIWFGRPDGPAPALDRITIGAGT